MPAQIAIDQEQIAEFCRRNQIRKLSLFDSVLTDRFGPESDVDVLVEFEPDASVGFFAIGRMTEELSTIIGRQVDLRTKGGISRYFRDQVIEQAEPVYAAA